VPLARICVQKPKGTIGKYNFFPELKPLLKRILQDNPPRIIESKMRNIAATQEKT
jgi:hypothetical protein